MSCPECAFAEAGVRTELKRLERRKARGLMIDITKLNQLKASKERHNCADRIEARRRGGHATAASKALA